MEGKPSFLMSARSKNVFTDIMHIFEIKERTMKTVIKMFTAMRSGNYAILSKITQKVYFSKLDNIYSKRLKYINELN